MKKLSFILMSIPCLSFGSAYFRPLDISHPKPIAGALLDPQNLDQTSATALLPLITHSPNDGCLMPSIVCVDWTPLAVGASMNGGNFTFNAAPLSNVLPIFQAVALAVTPAKWVGVIKVLTPSGDGSVTFSAGPAFEYKQATNRGYFRVFTGLRLSF